jgi:hypothetical protein
LPWIIHLINHQKWGGADCTDLHAPAILQGGEAAGLVADDLGEPDAAGVYAQHTATGTLYFRQAQPHPFAVPHWEWSLDKQLWIPTSYVSCMQQQSQRGSSNNSTHVNT